MLSRAVIFDNDGILVDTEPLHFEARRRVLAEYGIVLTKQAYIAYGISRSHREFLPAVWIGPPLSQSNCDALYYDRIQPLYHELRAMQLVSIPGIEGLIDRLCDHFLLGIVSTQPRQTVEGGVKAALGRHKALFHVIMSGDDVARNKPAPDVYLTAAKKLNVAPSCCLAIEDSHVGVRAAKAAFMSCIARRNEWASDGDLLAAGANLLIDSYDEITTNLINTLIERGGHD